MDSKTSGVTSKAASQASAKPSIVPANDPFLTEDAAQEYCSLLSTHESGFPRYLNHYQDFTDNVIDIPQDVFDDITKMHVERESQFKEAERKEEEKVAQQVALEEKLNNSRNKKLNRYMRMYKHFVKRSCPVKIPFKSTLNHEEHEFYLKAFMKFRYQTPKTSVEENEYKQYISMQNRVFDEQSCLMNFSYKVCQMLLKNYNEVSPFVDDHIKCYVSHKSERALTYPSHYRSEIEIPLKPQLREGSVIPDFQFNHIGHLLSLGYIPWLFIPNISKQVMFSKEPSESKIRPPDTDYEFDTDKYLYKCPVSEDPNAEFLAKQHNAQIVMSSSAFKVLVDNQEQPFDKEWYIPVKIKSCKFKNEKGEDYESRVIFIDKALPKKVWFPNQKKSTFFKASAIGQLTKHIQIKTFRMSSPPRSEVSDARVPSRLHGSQDALVDTFGSETGFERRSNKKLRNRKLSGTDSLEYDLRLTDDDESDGSSSLNSFKGNESHYSPSRVSFSLKTEPNKERTQDNPSSEVKQEEITEDVGLLDNLLDKQDTLLKPKLTKESNLRSPAKASPLKKVRYSYDECQNDPNKMPWCNTLSTNWEGYKVKQCPDSKGSNVHYQLFSFETSDVCPVKEGRKEPIKIIVRHNIHGITNYKKMKEVKTPKAYVLYPKLENQVFFGCEVNSLSEIVQQWASLVIRPNTTLLQVRVCVESGSVVMMDEKTLESVLKDGNQSHVNFRPQSVFVTLDVLFNSLMKMSSGQYLLHHSPKTEAFIKLYRAVDSASLAHQSSLNLHDNFKDGSVTSRQYASAPWLAIDTHVMTPFHLYHKKIPGTFPMEHRKKLNKYEKNKIRQRAKSKLEIDMN